MATTYDVVIVGSGYVGANLAYILAQNKKTVLIIEAGPGLPDSRQDFMENFYLNTFKSPSSPYPPSDIYNLNDLPAQTNAPVPTIPQLVYAWSEKNDTWTCDNGKSYFTYTDDSMPYASTYDRLAGGTGNHWMGTCLRMMPNDFQLKTLYGYGLDWPVSYNDLETYYGQAEYAIGVSADVTEQETVGPTFPSDYTYPMKSLAKSYWDQQVVSKVTGLPLTNEAYYTNDCTITGTPAGRNSEPYQNRRVCHGNTNCTPICPIQAKYDATVTLSFALDTGYVTILPKAVVDYITLDSDTGKINGVHYITYDSISVPASAGKTGEGTATGTIYVLAAHSVENAKILLNSAKVTGKNIANTSGLVGCNLMDHPMYLAWGLMPTTLPSYCYRGPISTSGIESMRDGQFRKTRAAWRIEIGNEGWNWPVTEPYTSGLDFVYGTNNSRLNASSNIYGYKKYLNVMNSNLTREFRIGFLVEQDAQTANRVQLSSTYTDNLGIPRPLITYQLSDYTKYGFQQAKVAATEFMSRLGATEYTALNNTATQFSYNNAQYNYSGAGHLCGTHVMGTTSSSSVVDKYQKSWDHSNLYLIGCGSHPSVSTQNPTLTMLAMVYFSSEQILLDLA
jgi:choline dehydrogenase-like flavoprotein